MVHQLEKFFEDDIHAALLVLGGVAMSFHFELLHNSLGGYLPPLPLVTQYLGNQKLQKLLWPSLTSEILLDVSYTLYNYELSMMKMQEVIFTEIFCYPMLIQNFRLVQYVCMYAFLSVFNSGGLWHPLPSLKFYKGESQT